MKIILRTAAFVVLILAVSCGKDTANAIADIFDKEAEELESTVLDIEKVADNVLIDGGTKMEGTPPTANGAISLDVSNTSKTAFLDEGFDVAFSSDGEVTGAYIQFKSTDGNISDAYYDVNLRDNSSNKGSKSLRRRRVGKSSSSSTVQKTDDNVLDVDFNETISPGEFCYEICVYDANGNISEPQEVCLTVESWGGKADLIAAWSLTEEGETYEGNLSTSVVGEPDCTDEASFACNQGGEYQAIYICYTTESVVLELKENGTYKLDAKESGRQINDESSAESCEAIYDEFRDDLVSNGRWAYVSEGNRLILIEYSFSELYRGETESGTYEAGDGEVLLDGTAELDGSTLIISQEYSEGTETFHFEK